MIRRQWKELRRQVRLQLNLQLNNTTKRVEDGVFTVLLSKYQNALVVISKSCSFYDDLLLTFFRERMRTRIPISNWATPPERPVPRRASVCPVFPAPLPSTPLPLPVYHSSPPCLPLFPSLSPTPPLPSLPSTPSTRQHVFRIHQITLNINNDTGQWTSVLAADCGRFAA